MIDFAFNSHFYDLSIRPAQDRDEILELAYIIYKMKPKVVVEIGTYRGGTLFYFTMLSVRKAKVISVDLPRYNLLMKAGGYFGYSRLRIPLYRSFATRNDQRIYLLRANSHDVKTLRKILKILDGEQIDFLFVDGDHSYEGAKKDFEMYYPFVRKGGLTVYHDIANRGWPGVIRFWNEIKQSRKYNYREIFSEKLFKAKQPDGRIGLIYK
nr:class I SAM-dependent methyltransferase [Candidatus Njordarchaeota archaeon]